MPELPQAGDEFAGYRLRSVLGRGGLSVVYEAESPWLGEVIALKVLAAELAADDVFRARFLREMPVAAALNHPHVIGIHDTGSQDGLLYIAMRRVRGTDLRQMLKERGRLAPDSAIFLLSQAASALDAVSRHGLAHRAVRPGNLLVERDSDHPDPGHLYLAGFGSTRTALGDTGRAGRGPRAARGRFPGTVDYLAPEQIRGGPVLGRADQYALGCVLYECLTGRVPFGKDLSEAVIRAHVEEQPIRPTLLRPDLPPPVDAVLARVLSKQPGDRFEDCREFIGAARDACAPAAAGDAFTLAAAGDAFALGAAGASVSRAARTRWPAPLADRQEIAHDQGAERRHPTATRVPPGLPPMDELFSATAEPDTAVGPTGLPPMDELFSATAEPGTAEGPDPDPDSGSGSGWHRRGGRRISVLLLAAALVLALGVGITIGAWARSSGLGSGQRPENGTPSAAAALAPAAPSSAASPGAAALAPPPLAATSTKNLQQALATLNVTVWTTGYLPAKSCTFLSAAYARCSHPYPGIGEAVFQNYSSPGALYQAYETAIKQVNNGHLRVNGQDCGSSAPPPGGAEIAWNHYGLHTRAYSIEQLETGRLNAASQAAGRMFCSYNSRTQVEDIIWTETDGSMLGEVTGAPHLAVWSWWLHVHHNIAFSGQPMGGMDMGPDPLPTA